MDVDAGQHRVLISFRYIEPVVNGWNFQQEYNKLTVFRSIPFPNEINGMNVYDILSEERK